MRTFITRVMLTCGVLFVSATAQATCINVSTANLREGPGTNFPKSWVVYRYMPLKTLEKKGEWTQVADVDGYKHWVSSDLISDDLHCAVVTKDKINIRSGPGIKFAKTPLSPVEKYYSFKVLETKGDWVKVQDEVNNEGWISDKLLWQQ